MPFVYELRLHGKEPSYTFVQQLVAAGSLLDEGQPVATLTDGAMEFHVLAPRGGLLVEWLAEHGDTLEDQDVMARIVCEGDAVEVRAAIVKRLG